jgi:hypothetical protein
MLYLYLTLPIMEHAASGVLNAIVFWYDLDLDEHPDTQISNAPPGIFATAEAAGAAGAGQSGRQAPGSPTGGSATGVTSRRCSRRVQALQYLDCALPVVPGDSASGTGDGRTVMLQAQRSASGIRFALRSGVGVPVPRPPFKVSTKRMCRAYCWQSRAE